MICEEYELCLQEWRRGTQICPRPFRTVLGWSKISSLCRIVALTQTHFSAPVICLHLALPIMFHVETTANETKEKWAWDAAPEGWYRVHVCVQKSRLQAFWGRQRALWRWRRCTRSWRRGIGRRWTRRSCCSERRASSRPRRCVWGAYYLNSGALAVQTNPP